MRGHPQLFARPPLLSHSRSVPHGLLPKFSLKSNLSKLRLKSKTALYANTWVLKKISTCEYLTQTIRVISEHTVPPRQENSERV